jgi:hypothetical protein
MQLIHYSIDFTNFLVWKAHGFFNNMKNNDKFSTVSLI